MRTRSSEEQDLIAGYSNPERLFRGRAKRRLLEDLEKMADQTTLETLTPNYVARNSIGAPTIEANNFEIKPAMIQMLANNPFCGYAHEDPMDHIESFIQTCATFKYNGVSSEAVRLTLFPFSLRDKASRWLRSFPNGHFDTWEKLHQAFMQEYFPPSAAIKVQTEILNFTQAPTESFSEAWDRLKMLKRKCPETFMNAATIMCRFYNGLRLEYMRELDRASQGGMFLKLSPQAEEQIIENLASNDKYWYAGKERVQNPPGLLNLDPITALTAKIEGLAVDVKDLKAQTSQQQQAHIIGAYQPSYPMYSAPLLVRASYPSPTGQELALSCEMCMGAHLTHTCPLYVQNQASPVVQNVNFMEYGQGQRGGGQFFNNQGQRGNFQQGGGTWRPENQNQGQRNAPNFQANFHNRGNSNQPAYVPPHQRQLEQPPVNAVLEKTVAELAKNQAEMHQRFSNLEALIRQLGSSVSRDPGSLPSSTEPNPREQVQAVTLRSGRTLPEVSTPPMPQQDDDQQLQGPKSQVEEPVATPIPAKSEEVQNEEAQKKKESKKTPPLPFPTRVKRNNDNTNLIRFMEHLKQLHINMPFMEALTEMPRYAKFLKDLLMKKRRWEEPEVVDLNAECSAVVLKTMPPKLKDPGSFLVPCSIENFVFHNALADLGASINLMPSSVVMKLGLGELKPTRMSLQLADRSVKYPKGILEDVLVRVDKFIFPVDFVVMDMEEDRETPLILGRPFLATARALVDVADGSLSLRVGDDVCTFKLSDVMSKASDPTESCNYLDMFELVEGYLFGGDSDITPPDSDIHYVGDIVAENEEEMTVDCEQVIRDDVFPKLLTEFEEQPPDKVTPELKPLPSHLEYAFLDTEGQRHVIISAQLESGQKEKLLDVLRCHEQVIARKLEDLRGISPTFCTHKIKCEEGYKPVVQPQRRLNPKMMDVVKAEVLRLLDVGIIYPISDSQWVSPTHVVPKKGGMTVVQNEKGELLPSRTVTGWRMVIDYRKLNEATRKDHFPLPFIDQLIESLAGHAYYCFLDGMSGYFQIHVDPVDQEKTTFTCPFGTFAFRRMSFGLCNAPATFMRCMIAIFEKFIGDFMEVFMDDFSIFGESFDECLHNLEKVLIRCEETHLALSWEKCHFMVKEGIVLGHKVSSKGIEVDKAKIEAIEKLPPPKNVKAVRSFLGHAGFYRRFIRDFSKIAKPLTRLLEKDADFLFDDECLLAFNCLKLKLMEAPVLVAPDWEIPFELMCDASDQVVGAILGQRKDNHFRPIYYASKTLAGPQLNYTTTEKELLAIVYALEKFRSYIILSEVIIYTDHSALRYLFQKHDSKPRLLRWILLLQEFHIEIRDRKGSANQAADHLSRLDADLVDSFSNDVIEELFPDERLLQVKIASEVPWYADIANYLVGNVEPTGLSRHMLKKFLSDAKYYFWDDPYLFRICADQVVRRCIPESEMSEILYHCHAGPAGGHFSGNRTARRVLECGYYWPTLFKDANSYVASCDRCQRVGNISKRDEMPQTYLLPCEVFDVWGIDFVGPFPSSRGNKFILVAIDYVSKWVEAIASPTNDARVVVRFVKKLFSRFGVPKVLISDRGTHFRNDPLARVLSKYGVQHRQGVAYHPQTQGQVENANRDLKAILEKTVAQTRKDWSEKLDDALWAFRTAYKTPIGTTPFRLVYGKSCHLPVEVEHRALWALNTVCLDSSSAGKERFFQLNELDEWRAQAFHNSYLYKERVKQAHDKHIKADRQFVEGEKVLLYNSRLRLFPGKLKSRWTGPYTVRRVYPYGSVEIEHNDGQVVKVNGSQLKHYFGGTFEKRKEVFCLEPV
ncbi:unnamed protein product [Cuscuta epithymum]|uniref:RNA-directed DNA polymerase n=1 Tax=Cuscuta epithymum TaxID=186058 RepID=A0AAV0DIQ3_9ASTE|nr:unnamed protein product [Cuscuta epithymum]